MTCPKCHAKLLRVQAEYFCLQCGEAVPFQTGDRIETPTLEATSDPVLRRAINDVSARPVVFAEPLPAAPEPPARPLPAVTAVVPPQAKPALPIKAEATPLPAIPKPAVVLHDVKPTAAKRSQVLHLPRIGLGLKPATVAPEILAVADQLKRSRPKLKLPRWLGRRLVLGSLLAVVAFLAINLAVGLYYAHRVYPGVRVADINLGGLPWEKVQPAVTAGLPSQPLQVVIGSTLYRLTPDEIGATYDLNTIARQAETRGHSYLPLWGLVNTFWSQPLAADYSVNQVTFSQRLSALVNEQSHPFSDAQPIIDGGTALLLSDKPGQSIDQNKLKAGLLTALKAHDKVVITTTNITPTVSGDAYKTDIAQAQAMLNVSLSVKLKTRTVSIPAAQVGQWLRFGAPGGGVSVDAAGVAAYVNSLGSGFDRSAAATAVISSLQTVKPLAYTASVRRATTASGSAATAVTAKSYHYCLSVSGASEARLEELAAQAKSVYTASGGWSLGGAVSFQPGASACNYTIWLASRETMASFSPACTNQSTCRVENNLIINLANWDAAPASWKGTQAEYRTELINHETGHWLGFDHLSCNGATTTAPIQDVVVQVAGCSPRWFPISADLQPIKILPGF